MKKIKKSTKENPFVLTGEKGILLAEACKLNKLKKSAEKRIKEIKKEFELTKKGEYSNKAGDILVLSSSDTFTEIDPEKLYKRFEKNRKKKKFWTVVKVQITPLKKLIPETSIEKLREKLNPVLKWSFK